MEDDEDGSEANGEEEWVADLVPDVWGGEVAEQAVPGVVDGLLDGGAVEAC
jgi:hypothetical protein